MKHSIYEAGIKENIFQRIDSLSAETQGRWGKLNATQMVRHLSEAARMTFGEIPMPDRSNFITRSLFKWMFITNKKIPGREKGKLQTFPEIDIVKLGLKTDDLYKEKERYKAIVERIITTDKLHKEHTVFGKMTKDEWGHLTYAHADYHLTQFNS
ncbi:MAG: DUF1569 domain-containing protein [Bacteroidota bacterium]